MELARQWGARGRRALIGAIMIVYAFALYFGADRINHEFSASAVGWQWLWIIGVPLLVAGLGFWPGFASAVERGCARVKFRSVLGDAGLREIAIDYELDFDTGKVKRSGHLKGQTSHEVF